MGNLNNQIKEMSWQKIKSVDLLKQEKGFIRKGSKSWKNKI
jgi:hypothetical protein